jgi:hypothetical protein
MWSRFGNMCSQPLLLSSNYTSLTSISMDIAAQVMHGVVLDVNPPLEFAPLLHPKLNHHPCHKMEGLLLP